MGERGGLNLYGFVNNSSINAIDPNGKILLDPVLIPMLVEALKQTYDCYQKMQTAKQVAEAWFNAAERIYTCCPKNGTGKVLLRAYPGCETGDKNSTYGVLHCVLGVSARKQGVGTVCINAANVLWEYKEFRTIFEWLPPEINKSGGKGFEGWLRDTKDDIESVNRGYFTDRKEDCIPASCHR